MSEKLCRKCGCLRPLPGGFDRDSRRPDGHKSLCKVCARELDKAHHERNRARRLDAMTAYRNENRAALRVRWNRFYRDHREQALAYQSDQRDRISDNYVRTRVGLQKEQATQEVVSLKRDAIAMRRLARLLKESAHGKQEDH